MIELQFPKFSEDRYLFWLNHCLGPFDLNAIYTGEKVEFNSSLRSLEQSRGIYGENDVEHQTLSGKFEYYPLVNGCTLAADTMNPKRIAVPIWNSAHSPETKYSQFGLATNRGVSFRYINSACTMCEQVATDRNPDTGMWSLWLVSAYATNDRLQTFTQHDILDISATSTNSWLITARTRSWTRTPGQIAPLYPFASQIDFETITSMMNFNMTLTQNAVKQYVTGCYQARIPEAITSTYQMKQQIETLVGSMLGGKEFPIPDYPYGDLAMRALNQVDSNHTNMIEFLRDLRHPLTMIPKLRNLRSLKAWSDRYLTVQYGILPTVRDIQTIVQAFKKREPYLDKNGFRIYAAGEPTSLIQGDLSFMKVQYLKVALDREDSEFKLLIERLENMGLFPDLEKIWDLVPYSFAIDWLVDVGNFLKRVDTNLRILRLDIRYVTMSRKTTMSGASHLGNLETPFVGTVDWTKYQRWVSDQCPGPTLSLRTPDQPFTHWVEAGALLLQRS